jgi:pimeloyl-ACP methyl ester carboxylesterase
MSIYFCVTENPEYKGKPCFLFGQSLGGAIALKLHFKQPDRWDGAVLVAPMCKVWLSLSFLFFLTVHFWNGKGQSLVVLWNFLIFLFWKLFWILNIPKSIKGNISFTATANHFNLATFVSQPMKGSLWTCKILWNCFFQAEEKKQWSYSYCYSNIIIKPICSRMNNWDVLNSFLL